MPELPPDDSPHWFVLNYIKRPDRPSPQREIDDFNRSGHSLELYAPIVRPAYMVKGHVVYRDRLLTYNYIFVRGPIDDVKRLCARESNGLSLMLNRGSDRRYAILSDTEMENFKIIARIHTNTIPFFNIEDIDLHEGDKVEVVDGEYAGLKGVFMPKARSAKGNLVIAATADMGAVVWDINVKHVRILEFAADTRRPYDIIDSFIPKLFPILRKFHANEPLSEKEKTTLVIFNRKMQSVNLGNRKLEAKLLALLMCVQTIIGDTEGYRSSARRYAKRAAAVTNPWTLALITLLHAVATNTLSLLPPVLSGLLPSPAQAAPVPESCALACSVARASDPGPSSAPPSAAPGKPVFNASQRLLLDEYNFYLNPVPAPSSEKP